MTKRRPQSFSIDRKKYRFQSHLFAECRWRVYGVCVCVCVCVCVFVCVRARARVVLQLNVIKS